MSSSLPSLFISHGSPMTALEPGAAGAFWSRLGPAIDAAFGRPQAILALSAHTLSRSPVLLAAAHHEAVHDFGGFPQALFDLRYPTAGAPALADQVQALMAAAGLPVHRHEGGGLDHGIWAPLRWIYPLGDVPVLPLAWPPGASPVALLALGQALAPLRHQGVLVMGTGAITHNLGLFRQGDAVQAPERGESAAFRQWMADRAAVADWDALCDWRLRAPHGSFMHPTDEHLLPWFIAAGAAGPKPTGQRLHASVEYGHLGMDAYAFGPEAAALQAALDVV